AKRVWQGRELSLGKLVMVWGGGYGLVISLMGTKLPWYGLPLFGPLALMAGEARGAAVAYELPGEASPGEFGAGSFWGSGRSPLQGPC
ncbi:MAG: hypothetical protein HC860_25355, partial [Alkalinema sp. RU_4_3]|nr:hypothetical protein [Alkalinema sp. RU_4_3]